MTAPVTTPQPGRRRRDCPPDAPALVRRPTPCAPPHPDLANAVDEELAQTDFSSRSTARRLDALVLVASFALTAVLALEAHQDRAGLRPEDLVPLALATTISLALWAARVLTPVVHLSVRGGVLLLDRDGDTWRCDLSETAVSVEVVGRPGQRGWRVVLQPRGLPPYVVDAHVVDPVRFTRVLQHYRPGPAGQGGRHGRAGPVRPVPPGARRAHRCR